MDWFETIPIGTLERILASRDFKHLSESFRGLCFKASVLNLLCLPLPLMTQCQKRRGSFFLKKKAAPFFLAFKGTGELIF